MHTEPGYITEKQAIQARLRRVEGQVRGLQRLVDEDTYCIDILTQISASTKALEKVALLLLDQHLQHCLAHADSPDDKRRKLTEASEAIARLVRS
ncbi:MAG TPA: metal-sensitive transcriptional regulator [Nocardioides sp.]|uniref:metal-sensitive transcriptional regulator n=1 Tax=uncultured Nocardioides sp. TaxID=198441 RepID=UPI000EDB22D9|nr:metal-sensitive transcriptional regulator [uncultured Nocardioides sp.]HCB06513.1 transcriptional regulator [Nocardioides sp.]HRD61031.1 metal-sensitive transcriptional regulator [Nocardioides sp.]HRI96145.1 metal-sensitive transcriptional regulator [Nocardioides sp.]HRK45934.1 metal-sensitive transcriptional regulator [Nocardioides sp.]